MTITVTDDNAVLSGEWVARKYGRIRDEITFTNKYLPGPTTLSIPVHKLVTGDAPEAALRNSFTFTLAPLSGAPAPAQAAVTLNANGDATLGGMTFAHAGRYSYVLREQKGSVAGFTYDTNNHIINVTVTDVNGQLQATWEGLDGETEKETIENPYTPEPVLVRLGVNKIITGSEPPANEVFTFTLTGEEGAPMPEDETLQLFGEMSDTFGSISFTKAGTYKYSVVETDGKLPGYTYETTPHKYQVVVTDVNGKLQAAVTADGKTGSVVTVTNSYHPTPADVEIPVKKVITGKSTPETDETFTFRISAVTSGAPLPEDQEITITGEGTGAFNLTFTQAGVYQYKVKEITGGSDLYTYDDSEFTVRVTVTDQHAILLAVANASASAPVTFSNKYNPNPKLKVTKTTVDRDRKYGLGERVEFTVVVENIGNVTLRDVKLNDELAGVKDLAIGTLAPGAKSKPISVFVTVTEEMLGQEKIYNTAVANGKDPGNNDLTDNDSDYFTPKDPEPAIQVTKTTVDKTRTYKLGEKVAFTIVVKNIGTVTLHDIVLTDELAEIADDTAIEVGTLAPDEESDEITVYVTVTEDMIGEEKVTNVATVTGKDPEEKPVDDDDDDDFTPDKPEPAIQVTKTTVDKTKTYKLGEKVEFTIVVKNTGNVTLHDIVLTDELAEITDEKPIFVGTLAPDAESDPITVYVTVTEDMIGEEKVTNTAAATGKDPEDKPVKDDDDDDFTPDDRKPAIKVTKTTADKTKTYKLGEKVEFTIVVENTGNVTLENVKVTDELAGIAENNAVEVGTLAPGAKSGEITVYVTVTEEMLGEEKVTNIAKATGEDPEDPEDPDDPDGPKTTVKDDDDDDFTPDDRKPGISITKITTSKPAEHDAYVLDETITYEVKVTNTGNTTLVDVKVEDKLTGDYWTVDSLAPGESKSFETEYQVTEADVLAGIVKNVATTTATDPENPDEPVKPDEPAEVEDPTYDDIVISLTVTKVWVDNNNAAGVRPASLNVTLSTGAVVTLNEANNWTATVENLPKYKDGRAISYTWTETAVLGYRLTSQVTNGNVTTLTNTRNVPAAPGGGGGGRRTPTTPVVTIEEYETPLGIGAQFNQVGHCFD